MKIIKSRFIGLLTLFFILLASAFLANVNLTHAQQAGATIQPPSILTMNEQWTGNVLPNGDIQVTCVISMSTVEYEYFTTYYPTESMYSRLFNPFNNPFQIEDLNYAFNGVNNTLSATYVYQGTATDQGSNWVLPVGSLFGASSTGINTFEKTSQYAKTIVFTSTLVVSAFQQITGTFVFNFPSSASNINYDSSTFMVTYNLPSSSQSAAGSTGNVFFLIGAGVLVALGIVVLIVGRSRVRKPLPPPPVRTPSQPASTQLKTTATGPVKR